MKKIFAQNKILFFLSQSTLYVISNSISNFMLTSQGHQYIKMPSSACNVSGCCKTYYLHFIEYVRVFSLRLCCDICKKTCEF